MDPKAILRMLSRTQILLGPQRRLAAFGDTSIRYHLVSPVEDMEAIAAIDKNCRLIKGQVFLWKKDQSWEDLWDAGGEITPP